MVQKTRIDGWLFDVQEEPSGIGLWIIDSEGKTHKLHHPFNPYFYLAGKKSQIRAALHMLESWKVQVSITPEERREFYSNKAVSVLKVAIDSPLAYRKIVTALTKRTDPAVELFTCDIPPAQLYLIETGLFPLAYASFEIDDATRVVSQHSVHDSPWSLDYALPPLSLMEISMEGGSGNPAHRPQANLTIKVDGAEQTIEDDPLYCLRKLISRHDPNVILTHWGDSYLLPNLHRLAAAEETTLPFDREASHHVPKTRGRSYFTYGKIMVTASSYSFRGRWHIDLENSFTVRECGLEGLIELARLSKIPVQRMARTSTGTCISAMQVERAMNEGYLIPWRKSQVEDFKTADELLVTDKGGLTYRPIPGFYEHVAELDFASMYPTLMAKYNLSPETVNCICCPKASRVPEAGHRICVKRRGLVPKTVEPMIAKRQQYKEKIKAAETESQKEIYNRRQSALKWCLVTCFGYLGYRNARFGKIEAHEATTVWSREKLLQAKEVAESLGYNFLHGLTDCLWVQKGGTNKEDYLKLAGAIEEATEIPISFEGLYHWISFLPSRQNAKVGVPARFVGVFEDGKLKVRGLMARKHDTPRFVKKAQQSMLEILSHTWGRTDYKEILQGVVLPLVESYSEKLINGRLRPEDVAILRRLSHDPLGYKHGTMTAAVSQELIARGVRIMPGEAVQMVITDASAKDPSLRARSLGFLDLPHSYDREKYLEIFFDAIREIDLDGVLEKSLNSFI